MTASDELNESPDFAQWCRSKGHDTFGCIGPVIATALDWRQARVVTRLDGVERQNYPLSDMIMSPVELVSRLSRDLSLLPGDVIACGTSLGVGSMKDGCIVEVEITGSARWQTPWAHAVSANASRRRCCCGRCLMPRSRRRSRRCASRRNCPRRREAGSSSWEPVRRPQPWPAPSSKTGLGPCRAWWSRAMATRCLRTHRHRRSGASGTRCAGMHAARAHARVSGWIRCE